MDETTQQHRGYLVTSKQRELPLVSFLLLQALNVVLLAVIFT